MKWTNHRCCYCGHLHCDIIIRFGMSVQRIKVEWANFVDLAPKLVAWQCRLSDRRVKVRCMICTHRSTIPENLVKIGLGIIKKE